MTRALATNVREWVDPFAAVDRADLAASTKKQYHRALRRFFSESGGDITDVEAVQDWVLTLPVGFRGIVMAALGLYLTAIETKLMGEATPKTVDDIQAVMWRLQALRRTVKAPKRRGGSKVHTWLSAVEVQALLNSCGPDIVGQRDRLALGLMVAAGLRREEAANLRFEDIKLLPVGDRIRTVLDVLGKGGERRAVPISDALANAIDNWGQVVGGEGCVLRSLGMKREPGKCLSAQAVFAVVKKRGRQVGKPELAPHDLRRTFAQLALEGGISIMQISRLLGHASVRTTERYLNIEVDLRVTASDVIPF